MSDIGMRKVICKLLSETNVGEKCADARLILLFAHPTSVRRAIRRWRWVAFVATVAVD